RRAGDRRLRRDCGPGRQLADSRLGERRDDGRLLGELRLRRHRRGAARAQFAGRLHSRGAPVRRLEAGRRADGGAGGRLVVARPDHAGPGRRAARGLAAHPRPVGGSQASRRRGHAGYGGRAAVTGIFDAAWVAATISLTTPVLFAALGETIAERTGTIDVGLEGMMLVGAFFGFLVSWQTGSPWLGVLAGLVAGAALAAVMAVLSIEARADQIVTGIGLNILAFGVT